MLVDAVRPLLHAAVTPTDVQDHDRKLLGLFALYPLFGKLPASAAHARSVYQDGLALATPAVAADIV